MRFSRDRRGQSVVVGTVILFGFLILALGVYQVQVVSTDNANVEFEHSQTVEDDFGDLRNDVLRAGSTGSTGSTQIRLGTRYPARTFFVNPPPVSGSLETEPTDEIRIRNATVGDGAHRNARDFWNTSPAFPTRSLRYGADYNEFDGAPELVYEHSVVAAEFDDAVLLRTGQTVVSEDRISLTALTGSVSESGIEPRSVDPRTVSESDTTVPLEPTGGNVTLELPTAVGNASALADRWTEALPAGATAAPNATGEAIRITLANGSDPYRLALSEVSLDASGETEPAYVVPVDSESAVVGETVTVEVRDRYNNPVPDATVSFGGENRTTGDDGRAFFEPTASGTLVATINGSTGPTYESVTFDVSAGGGGGGTVNRTYDVDWDEIDPVQVEEGTSESLDILVTDAASGAPIDDAAVEVAFAPIGTVSGVPSVAEPSETDADGRTAVSSFDTNEASAGDNFTLYATSGDDVDTLRVEIVESTTTYEIVSVDAEGTGSSNNIDVTFDIDTTDPDAQVNVQSIESNGDVRDDTGLIDVSGSQPQTVTIKGANQAVEIRVILYDGAGNEQDRQEQPYP
ncbi:hypothetical protein R3751_12300 [Halorubrum distributum]|uniref:hypothetical protein n=1 Tax=Halorubrum distributum TaxID=29283 RepID=UPI0029546E50|nr:hypothetical protein [Halorubrum distributum]MDV7350552.1 hypothetical protein [Halorubrum distributum]